MILDALRLAFGTFTAFPVAPPRVVDRRTGALAVCLAALPAALLGLGAAVVARVGSALGLPALATGLVAVAWLLLATRAFHADGLADTVDGLTCGYDPERSLAVMRTGDVGPAGAAALVVVLGLDASLVGELAARGRPLDIAVAVVASRAALVVACRRGVPPARPEGLGALVAGSVGPAALGLVALGAAAVGTVAGPAGVAGVAAAFACSVVLVRHARRRVGGVTGDVLGAVVESSCAVALLVLVAAGG